MKKLIVLFLCLFTVLAINAQSATVISKKLNAVTLVDRDEGETGEFITPIIEGEYDVSLQMHPALANSGDSLNFSYLLYLSDSGGDDVWTIVSTGGVCDTVDTATDPYGLVYWEDLKSLRVKVVMTNLTNDTVTVTPYVVFKKHANE